MWQNIVFSIGNVLFSALNIPMIHKNKDLGVCYVPYITSVGLTLTIFSFAFTFYTLSLYGSAMTGLMTAYTWLIIVYQKWYYGNRR